MYNFISDTYFSPFISVPQNWKDEAQTALFKDPVRTAL